MKDNPSDPIDYLASCLKQHPQLLHCSNILTKWNRKGKSKNEQKTLRSLIIPYADYLKSMLAISGDSKEDIEAMTDLLNGYYAFLTEHDLERSFSSQGKFRSTILEEFLFLLFRNFIHRQREKLEKGETLKSGSVKAYSNLYIKARDLVDFVNSPGIGINEKDQDFAIYKELKIAFDDRLVPLNVPALAVEVKTYIDKTMLDSIIATAEKVKNGNPHARFVALAESYDVSFKVDPSYSRIDQIYVLRKQSRKEAMKPIDADVVWMFYHDSHSYLLSPWTDIERSLKTKGTIL